MQYNGWTITEERRQQLRDGWEVILGFTKGEESFNQRFRGIVSREGLAQAVRQFLDNRDTVLPEISEIEFTPVVREEQPPVVDTAREKWTADWNALQKVNKLKDNGVEVLTSAQYTALVNKVRTGFKKEYEELV